MAVCFFGKTGPVAAVPLGQCCTVNSECYTTTALEKFEKRTREDESLFTMAMRVRAHRLKSAPFWSDKTSKLWTALTSHPMTSLYFRTSRKFCVVTDFRQTPIFVQLVFSSRCKQHKWWLYLKPFWVQLCLQMSNFPMKMSNCSWQNQKYTRPETCVATHVDDI